MSTERVIDDELRSMLKSESVKPKREQPSSLFGRWLMEADDETEENEDIEENDEETEEKDTEEDDDDLEKIDKDFQDLEGFGSDDSDVQNEYDEEELTTLNKLIADEQEAIQGYFDAAEKSKHDVLIRLYSDIGKEERFHTEQLLYAKAELTGEKYEPSDPKVKEEYEELLEMGMDEESAMTTISDKYRISSEEETSNEDELAEMEEDLKALEEGFVQSINNCDILLAIQESGSYKNHADLRKAYNDFAETVFMEAMDNVNTKQGSEILGTSNPFIIIGRAIKNVYMFIIKIIKKIKNYINKRRIKSKRTWEWIKKHGIKGLFANGFSLYFWNDQVGAVEVSDAVSFMNLCIKVTNAVASSCGIPGPKIKGGGANGSSIPGNIKNKNPINFTSISDGASKIDGVVFSKSKVVVTDQNQTMLENIFFGYSDSKFGTGDVSRHEDGSIKRNSQDSRYAEDSNISYKSENIYNAFNYISEWAAEQLKATEEWMNTLQNIASNQKSVFYTKPELFKECVAAMKSVSKGYTRLIKCLSSDIQACMKLDQSLLNAVDEYDKQYSDQRNASLTGKSAPKPEVTRGMTDSEGTIRRTDKLN